MSKETVLRVGVYNNFNFTKAEIDAVAKYTDDYLPFVNSNSFVTISAEYPSIITINPYLDSWHPPTGDISNVKACRVKWVAGAKDNIYQVQQEAIKWCVNNNIPVLVTFMRFASRASMMNYVSSSCELLYSYQNSYYRLPVDVKHDEVILISSMMRKFGCSEAVDLLLYTCDISGKGCPACGNCSRLTYGLEGDTPVSLSLSCSGDNGSCIFHCPDCWAKRLSKITKFKFDVVTKNNKQKGKTNNE